ncbi:MAG: WhiB family transcriptional regulator [bacterium]
MTERVNWEAPGLCARPGTDVDAFFELEDAVDEGRVADFRRVAYALGLCGACPVRRECLHRGTETRSYGIWGGTTAKERGMRYGTRPEREVAGVTG